MIGDTITENVLPLPQLLQLLAISSKPMKPLKLAKATALAFALGAILCVGSDPAIMYQAEAIAIAKAQASMQKVSRTLGVWLEWGLDAALKRIVKQVFQDG
jgi:hypothetical protein